MKKPVLVIGGAGYIGSHMCKHLAETGYTPVVLDNFVFGHADAVRWGPVHRGSLSDAALLSGLFDAYDFLGVMYFAAFTYVGESVTDPVRYYRNNVADTVVLLETLARRGISRFIFSSSCAVYGDPVETPMTEAHPRDPVSPYGRTKRMVEEILWDCERAYGLKSVCLRYFNAAGADRDGELGEDHRPETHLIPLALQAALGKRDGVRVFGTDYPTADGTCIRDYIHVEDIARAHRLALEGLMDGMGGDVFNLGNGRGYSVREVIEAARRITGAAVPAYPADRRPGDPPVLIGSSDKAASVLGWRPRYPDLDTMVKTAWEWRRNHPEGYRA